APKAAAITSGDYHPAHLHALAQAAVDALDLQAGQSLHASLLGDHLLLAAHPLCVDEASWSLLLTDLNLALAQLRLQRPVRLSYSGGNFTQWTRHQQAHAESDALDDAWEHWLQYAGMDTLQLPDNHQASNVVELSLSGATSGELKRLADVLHLEWNSLLATAVAEQCGDGLLALDLYAARPATERLPVGAPLVLADLEPQLIVGALDLAVPVFLQAAGANALQRLQSVAAQLRAYPQHGTDYGALRYLSDNTYLQEPLRDLPAAPIAIHWRGDFDIHREPRSLLAHITAANTPAASTHALRIDAHWQDGQLHLRVEGALAADWA
ncbi:condensation domain-containing protein, partial [Pseudomonas sp. K5002]|uniref:condensation domain-containing protein n=1 Tax=Pseudomonas sp. K5002 TaxID=2738828 RepID=UPI0017E70012